MSKPLGAIPMEGALFRRVKGEGFELDLRRTLRRDGRIDIRYDQANQKFDIELPGDRFADMDRALRKAPKATIDLNQDGVFEIVQECRDRWQAATSKYRRQHEDDPQRREFSVYALEWDNPLDDQQFRAVAGELATAGADMFEALFGKRTHQLEDVAQRIRRVVASKECVLTINTEGFHIPWRMLYTHPPEGGKLADDGSNYDPKGFWGYQHVIEEFTGEFEYNNCLVANRKLEFAAALHEAIDKEYHVPCLKRHHDFVQASDDRIAYSEWTKKNDVKLGLSADDFKYQVVYFLCHAEVAGTAEQPNKKPPELRVTDGSISPAELTRWTNHLFYGHGPLVFINACQGGQLDTLVYRDHTFASTLLKASVACLIAPQIEVPAVFAGEFGKRFFEQLIADDTPTPIAGEVLRDLSREVWVHRNPFGLVYSLYAGADCQIVWSSENKQ